MTKEEEAQDATANHYPQHKALMKKATKLHIAGLTELLRTSIITAKLASAPRKVTKKQRRFKTNWAAAPISARTTGAATTTEKGGALEIMHR